MPEFRLLPRPPTRPYRGMADLPPDSVTISGETGTRLGSVASRRGMTLNALVEEILAKFAYENT